MANKNNTKMQNKAVIIISIVALIGIFFGMKHFYNQSQSEKSIALSKEQALLFQRPYSFVEGEANSKVQLVEFFDPACATCAEFYPYVKDIFEENYGDIKLVFRYAPYHTNSQYAVKMLEGAREQNMFLEVLEHMFATQNSWVQHHNVNPNLLWKTLFQVKGLDMKKLSMFMKSSKADDIIKQDLEDAAKLGATKTPSYFVNGKPLQEFGLENLKTLINSELSK